MRLTCLENSSSTCGAGKAAVTPGPQGPEGIPPQKGDFSPPPRSLSRRSGRNRLPWWTAPRAVLHPARFSPVSRQQQRGPAGPCPAPHRWRAGGCFPARSRPGQAPPGPPRDAAGHTHLVQQGEADALRVLGVGDHHPGQPVTPHIHVAQVLWAENCCQGGRAQPPPLTQDARIAPEGFTPAVAPTVCGWTRTRGGQRGVQMYQVPTPSAPGVSLERRQRPSPGAPGVSPGSGGSRSRAGAQG